jgi:hypothetical protein
MKYPDIELEGKIIGHSWRGDGLYIAVAYPDFATHYGGTSSLPLEMTTRQVLDVFGIDDLKELLGKTVYLRPNKTGRGYSPKFQIARIVK